VRKQVKHKPSIYFGLKVIENKLAL